MLRAVKRWTRRIAGMIATVALLGAGGAVAYAVKPPPDPAVDGRTLHASLRDAAGAASADPGACTARRQAGTWRCDVGGAAYRVAVTGAGPCWTARLVDDGSEGELPGRVVGCVRGKRWSPWDLVR
jgi:hypothetical protein